MELFSVSADWKAAYPGAAAGILAMRGVANPTGHPALDERKRELEDDLRARYAGLDSAGLKALERIQPYIAHYKRFDKSYHVLQQLESVVMKGRPISSVAALVEAMFLAELKNFLLTAGHDLAVTRPPLTLNVATGRERYTRINGQEQTLKAGDMFIADAEGVISDVIYGPDSRTRITPDTSEAIFTVYAPAGIGEEAVRRHLEDIRDYVLLIAPRAEVTALEIHLAS